MARPLFFSARGRVRLGSPATPAPIAGACVWHGAEIAYSTRWRRALAPEQVTELDAALAAVRGRRFETITRRDFPLPRLAPLLADIADQLEHGSGMVLLQGLPAARYGEDELRLLWTGLGANLGTPVFQNCRGEMMRAIRDEAAAGADLGTRYGELKGAGDTPFLSSYARTLSNGRLRFHTDRRDAVGLLCVRQAARGGLSLLASSPAVHNAMLARRPDLAEALYRPVWRSRARTPFEDDAATGRDRLLLRLWLAMPNSRALPEGHEVLWRSTMPGALRGGIAQA